MDAPAVRRLMVFAPHTPGARSRSGVQRVTIECIDALCRVVPRDADGRLLLDLVTWDPVDGQMRHYGQRDVEAVFAGRDWPDGLRVHPCAHRIGMRFGDTVPPGDEVCVLMPEVFTFLPQGNEIHARAVSQCIGYGWQTAAIFYDLIPITNAAYRTDRSHHRYVAELLRIDHVLSISHFSQGDLLGLYAALGLPQAWLDAAGQRFHPIPLPSTAVADDEARPEPAALAAIPKTCIVALGTVEPRKRQVEIVRAFQRLQIGRRSGLVLRIIGNLHPQVAAEFSAAIAEDEHIRYSGFATDAEVADAFEHALFSVFASDDEGFGLPITESLAHGVPCLTASFGAMAEAAEGGGCLTVDVRDEAALAQGIARMTFDAALVGRLRAEIAQRPQRSWQDYAQEVWGAVFPPRAAVSPMAEAAGRLAAAVRGRARAVTLDAGPLGGEPGSTVTVAVLRGVRDKIPPYPAGGLAAAYVAGPVASWSGLGAEEVAALAGLDAVFFEAGDVCAAVLDAAMRHGTEHMLPGWFRAVPPGAGPAGAVPLLASALVQRRHRQMVARREANLRAATTAIGLGQTQPLLTVMISTYNRGRFVAANVAWVLQHMAAHGNLVELVVVDNTSTDDTEARLAQYAGHAGFTYIRNPSNTGMLGNLHVCSTLMRGRHVWLIGDDDFMMPDTLPMLLRVLTMDRAVPFVFMNFGVFHRAAMTDGDSAAMFVNERHVLAADPAPTGTMPVREAGVQHDNLFTAIYPIVSRSDILARVFNHPFTGKPFRSLVESVPTTDAILSSYAETEAMWLAACGIVGNAHNSWQRHRVAWHGVLTPVMLELARQAGMDGAVLHNWGLAHVGLLKEAQALFPDETVVDEFSDDELATSRRVLRGDYLSPARQAPQEAAVPAPRTLRAGKRGLAGQAG